MEPHKLKIQKKHLEMIYTGLTMFRDEGVIRDLDADDIIQEQKRVTEAIKKADGDPNKILATVLTVEENVTRAQIEAFRRDEADLDILIAKIQVLRKKLESDQDSTLVDDFLKEIE